MGYERRRPHAVASPREVNAVVSAFLLTFAALFPIVNPIEGAPFFLGLTAGLSSAERRVLAGKTAVNGFALLLGWKLLTQDQWTDHAAGVQAGAARKIGSFYPLTMPLTVGPGSMSVAITIGSRKPATDIHLTVPALHGIGALVGVIAIAVTIYIAYRFAETFARVLGANGLEVVVR